MYLPTLTDDELIRYAEQVADSLTTTDLERELLKRWKEQIAEGELDTSFAAVLEDFDHDSAENLRADLDLAAAVRESVENNPYQPLDN